MERFLLLPAIGLKAALVLVSATGSGLAQSDEAGRIPDVVVERCAGCHIATGFHDDDTGADAPRFSEIMAKPDVYTPDQLKQYLANPHWPMSQFSLSGKDIDEIVGYLTAGAPAR